MAEFSTRSLRCPLCSTEFSVDVPAPGALAGRDTDFRPRFVGPDPLPTAIDSCPTCRFTAYPRSFGWAPAPSDEVDDEFWRLGWNGRKPAALDVLDDAAIDDMRAWVRRGGLTQGRDLDGREPYGSVRYLLGARCYEYVRDRDNLGVADYYLRGSWCARGQNEERLEQRLQREAVARLSAAVAGHQVPQPDSASVAYLIAELSRRAGDFPRAVDYYGRASEMADPDDADGLRLRRLARRQVALATVKSAVNAVIQEPRPGDLDDE